MSDAAILAISLDRSGALGEDLFGQLRGLILSGRLPSGTRLPASRMLANELSVSRTTVNFAYDQLAAEGYVEARRGSGVYVASPLPEAFLTPEQFHPAPEPEDGAPLAMEGPPAPFALGVPETKAFPHAFWGRLLARTWRADDPYLTSPAAAGGHPRLRQAIAGHVRQMRGIDCSPDQVIVTSGAREGIDLVARALIPWGSAAWVEEPGYAGTRLALASAGVEVVAVPVDKDGIDVREGRRIAPGARIAVVTPGRHYPLGQTMTLPRRLELLEWAASAGAWLVEDDYDSDYRYAGRPIAPLASLDRPERVIYLGSFSKVLFHSLRLGYLVAPRPIARRLLASQERLGSQASLIAQPALAALIEEGEFSAHIRRMRRLYGQRQRALVDALQDHCGGLLQIAGKDAGMHLVGHLSGRLARRMSDVDAEKRARAAGINVLALSRFYSMRPAPQGLLMGFAAWSNKELAAAASRLGDVLRG